MLQKKQRRDLSGVSSTHISLPFISAGEAGPLHLEADLTRAKFDELTADLVEKTKVPFDNALKDAGLTVMTLTGYFKWWFYSYSSCSKGS